MSISKIAVMGLCTLLVSGLIWGFYQYGSGLWSPYYYALKGRKTLQQVIDLYGENARQKLKVDFERAGVPYPSSAYQLIAFKQERKLELWAKDNADQWVMIKVYPILAASGKEGPKLREGDKQVPEGIYQIEGFNPNSAYHLSMKLNYPNAFDLFHAKREERHEPGTNIFIHGKRASIGCLAMGDAAIEELFTFVHDVGRKNGKVLISPYDARPGRLQIKNQTPEWVGQLYQAIDEQLIQFPKKTG